MQREQSYHLRDPQSTYLDRKFVSLHGWINEKQQGRSEQRLILLLLHEAVKVSKQVDCSLLQVLAGVVKADEALFRVDLPLELEHLLAVFFVDDEDILFAFFLLDLKGH